LGILSPTWNKTSISNMKNLVKWPKDIIEWGIYISLTLGVSLVLFDTMWIDLCEVQGEVEQLLQFCIWVLIVCSIMWLHPHFHPRHTHYVWFWW
jgi:hypothetical protein